VPLPPVLPVSAVAVSSLPRTEAVVSFTVSTTLLITLRALAGALRTAATAAAGALRTAAAAPAAAAAAPAATATRLTTFFRFAAAFFAGDGAGRYEDFVEAEPFEDLDDADPFEDLDAFEAFDDFEPPADFDDFELFEAFFAGGGVGRYEDFDDFEPLEDFELLEDFEALDGDDLVAFFEALLPLLDLEEEDDEEDFFEAPEDFLEPFEPLLAEALLDEDFFEPPLAPPFLAAFFEAMRCLLLKKYLVGEPYFSGQERVARVKLGERVARNAM
jgi:hypothetical protein